jgi:hypothetical protein
MSSFSEYLAVISDNIVSISRGLTFKKLVSTLIILVVMGIILSLIFDYLFGTLYFNRINAKLDVIERIEHKSSDSVFQNRIDSTYLSLADEINNYRTKRNLIKDVIPQDFSIISKIISAALIPMLIILSSTKNANSKNTIIGGVFFLFLFVILSLFMPTIYSWWVTALIIIILELVFLFALVRFQNSKNKKDKL